MPSSTASFRSNSSNRIHGSSTHRQYLRSWGSPSAIESVARLASLRESEMVLGDGHWISGILYKWVNYGKGWRPRWFLLQDGVLAYYKIHGHLKIILNDQNKKLSNVVGEESMRWISRHSRSQSCLPNPVGEIHLKVEVSLLLLLLFKKKEGKREKKKKLSFNVQLTDD